MTTVEQEKISKSYDWCSNVFNKQGKVLGIEDMWKAYPFKSSGLNKEGLRLLLENMEKFITHNK